MNANLAFVGDIHGNAVALKSILAALSFEEISHVVFLGDYINKGLDSAEVLDVLIGIADAGDATLLAGNHETALLDALDTHDLSAFLKMGGAATIRSYLNRPVASDVFSDFSAHLPSAHIEALRRMATSYETDELFARHTLSRSRSRTQKFCISAHVPVGTAPLIAERSAQLDTGCGVENGRLTALIWPSLRIIQVDSGGRRVATA